MLDYDLFIKKVDEAGFYTPFVNYIKPLNEGKDLSNDTERTWRMRATQEKKLACGYFFNGKPGYIAPHYISIFIDAFKPLATIEERYESGKLNKYELDIWNLLNQYSKPLSISDFKNRLKTKGIDEQRKLEAALYNLQTSFDVAICGGVDSLSKQGDILGQILGYDKIESCVPAEWMELNPRMKHNEALEIIYRQAEKISQKGEALKAFKKSLKLYI